MADRAGLEVREFAYTQGAPFWADALFSRQLTTDVQAVLMVDRAGSPTAGEAPYRDFLPVVHEPRGAVSSEKDIDRSLTLWSPTFNS